MLKKLLAVSLILISTSFQANSAFAESVRETPVVKAIQKSAKMVVNIGTEKTVLLGQNPFWRVYGDRFDNYYQNFFNTTGPMAIGKIKVQSLGSGIIVSPDGLIATNAHVISMASKIFVTMPGGETKEAILIGTDHANDIALIQVYSPEPVPYLRVAKDILIGETVISVGSPLGLQNSVSAGIISGTNRTFYTQPQIEAFRNLIQTDASINPGSSGGALINLEGNLVGMNVAMIQDAQSVGFAIPASKIKRMLGEYEKVKKPK